MIRPEVAAVIAMGPLPLSDADEVLIRRHEQALGEIVPPVSSDEAVALAACFGTDDSYGLAWTLLHLIESSPTPVVGIDPGAGANEWLRLLWRRANPR